jgi:hypothetical protein
MSTRRAAIESVFAHLEQAPFFSDHWVPMLQAMRVATGGSLTQFIAWGDAGRNIPALVWSEPWEENAKEWIECGGADPSKNPIVRAGATLGQFQTIADWEIMPKRERDRHQLLGDFYQKKDVPYICISKPLILNETHFVLSSLRSERLGPIEQDEREAFVQITRATSLAIRRARAVKKDGAKVLSGALDALSICGFVFDAFARVVALSRAAEVCVQCSGVLKLRRGVLLARADADTLAIERAVLTCARRTPGSPPSPAEFVQLKDAAGRTIATAHALPLPHDRCDIGLGAAVLLIVEQAGRADFQMLARRWGLTRAEFEVAAALVKGARASEIAKSRQVSRETARTQIKKI